MENTPIKVTYGDINEFAQAAKLYLNQKDLRPSLLTLALGKMVRLLKPHLDALEDLIAEKRIELSFKDKDGVLQIHDNGTYKLSGDSAKKLQSIVRNIYALEVEVTPYYARTVPKNLALPWYEHFIPFVIADYPEVVEE